MENKENKTNMQVIADAFDVDTVADVMAQAYIDGKVDELSGKSKTFTEAFEAFRAWLLAPATMAEDIDLGGGEEELK